MLEIGEEVTDEVEESTEVELSPLEKMAVEYHHLKEMVRLLSERVALLEGVAHNTHTIDGDVINHIAAHAVAKINEGIRRHSKVL